MSPCVSVNSKMNSPARPKCRMLCISSLQLSAKVKLEPRTANRIQLSRAKIPLEPCRASDSQVLWNRAAVQRWQVFRVNFPLQRSLWNRAPKNGNASRCFKAGLWRHRSVQDLQVDLQTLQLDFLVAPAAHLSLPGAAEWADSPEQVPHTLHLGCRGLRVDTRKKNNSSDSLRVLKHFGNQEVQHQDTNDEPYLWHCVGRITYHHRPWEVHWAAIFYCYFAEISTPCQTRWEDLGMPWSFDAGFLGSYQCEHHPMASTMQQHVRERIGPCGSQAWTSGFSCGKCQQLAGSIWKVQSWQKNWNITRRSRLYSAQTTIQLKQNAVVITWSLGRTLSQK